MMTTAVVTSTTFWNLEDMSFNTTVSNTGYTNGARALLQAKLGKEVFSCGCRHHIFELVLQAAFSVCLRWSSGSEILLFIIFTEQWGCIDQNRFSTARDYNATAGLWFQVHRIAHMRTCRRYDCLVFTLKFKCMLNLPSQQ